jgi:hypothetical protein
MPDMQTQLLQMMNPNFLNLALNPLMTTGLLSQVPGDPSLLAQAQEHSDLQPQAQKEDGPVTEEVSDSELMEREDILRKVLGKTTKRKRGRKLNKSEKDSKSVVSDSGSIPTNDASPPGEASDAPLSTLNEQLLKEEAKAPASLEVIAKESAQPSLLALSHSEKEKEVDPVHSDFLPSENWGSELNPFAPEWTLPAHSYVPPPPPVEVKQFTEPKYSWKTVPGAPGYKSTECQTPYVKPTEPAKPKQPFQTQRVMNTIDPDLFDHYSPSSNTSGCFGFSFVLIKIS